MPEHCITQSESLFSGRTGLQAINQKGFRTIIAMQKTSYTEVKQSVVIGKEGPRNESCASGTTPELQYGCRSRMRRETTLVHGMVRRPIS